MAPRLLMLITLSSALAAWSGAAPPPATTAEGEPGAGFQTLAAQHLPHPIRIHPRVITGGVPEGEPGFAELRSWGIQTIISVDGARPDVATAARFGLRYVHLPHGYDGIPESRAAELAKGVRDLPGPIYIHCHHGLHRSPAAGAVACVGAGLLPPSVAVRILEGAGTSPHYRGLYESAQQSRPFPAATLDRIPADFPSIAQLPAMAEVMVAVEQAYGNLLRLERSGWQPLENRPDTTAEHEALLLREHFTELLRSDSVRNESGSFQALLRDAERLAGELEISLRSSTDPETRGQALQQVTANCRTCHQRFRDIPLSQKHGVGFRLPK